MFIKKQFSWTLGKLEKIEDGLPLKAHQQIAKKWCCEKYQSCDKACQKYTQTNLTFFSSNEVSLKNKALRQSVIQNFRAACKIFLKGYFWCSFTQKYLKITLFFEKRAPYTYKGQISFGLFPVRKKNISCDVSL